MSLINEYRATEEAIKELQTRLQSLTQNDSLKKEIEFEGKLRALMSEYGVSLKNIIQLLDPQGSPRVAGKKTVRKERSVKTYKNPNTNEIIETKGGNHKGLKQWKEAHGSDVVESWLQ